MAPRDVPGRVDLDSRLFLRKHPSSEWFLCKRRKRPLKSIKNALYFWKCFLKLRKNGPAGLRILIHYTVVFCFLSDTVDIYKWQKCCSMPVLGGVFVLQKWDRLFLLLGKLHISDTSINNYCLLELLWIFSLPSESFKPYLITSKEKKGYNNKHGPHIPHFSESS